MDESYTPWFRWGDRFDPAIDAPVPGVYVLAITSTDLRGQPFSWIPEIAYVGMTNSRGGLGRRLYQFDNTIRGREGHGGACRVRYVHRYYDDLVNQPYVAVRKFPCNVWPAGPEDLRVMGEVAREEYSCFAEYCERFGSLPQFNRRDSPKLSGADLANIQSESDAFRGAAGP